MLRDTVQMKMRHDDETYKHPTLVASRRESTLQPPHAERRNERVLERVTLKLQARRESPFSGVVCRHAQRRQSRAARRLVKRLVNIKSAAAMLAWRMSTSICAPRRQRSRSMRVLRFVRKATRAALPRVCHPRARREMRPRSFCVKDSAGERYGGSSARLARTSVSRARERCGSGRAVLM